MDGTWPNHSEQAGAGLEERDRLAGAPFSTLNSASNDLFDAAWNSAPPQDLNLNLLSPASGAPRSPVPGVDPQTNSSTFDVNVNDLNGTGVTSANSNPHVQPTIEPINNEGRSTSPGVQGEEQDTESEQHVDTSAKPIPDAASQAHVSADVHPTNTDQGQTIFEVRNGATTFVHVSH